MAFIFDVFDYIKDTIPLNGAICPDIGYIIKFFNNI